MKHQLKRFKSLTHLLMITSALLCGPARATPDYVNNQYANEAPITFQANNGEKVAAFRGSLNVPENRANPDSRMITLDYVRFPQTGDHGEPGTPNSKTSAAPIVYLAGGPGGSGIQTAKHQRFPLFMAMREFGDVIAFDQRGINEGRLPCQSTQVNNYEQVTSNEQDIETMRQAIKDCLSVWQKSGVDIHGYTTRESARDLDDLRKHLNASKLSLWGISYGSHLALAAMKQMPDSIDKVVISSVEGLNQTIKMPARTDEYFSRLQTAINDVPSLKTQYPNIKSMITKVHQQLDKKPLILELTKADKTIKLVFQKSTMRSIASRMIADPSNAIMLLGLYKSIELGDTGALTQVMSQHYPISSHLSLSGMSTAMDLASGITEKRKNNVIEQAKTSLLGYALNFGLHHFEDIDGLDLGDSFRVDPVTDIPTLVLSGTLDGRTYIESQLEAVKGLRKATLITVEHAGHNLFMSSPEVTQTIQKFMRNQAIEDTTISIDIPNS